jgi:hypothetical protein
MPWVEINLHTGERIAHTTTSLENRLRALRASIDTLMRLGELVNGAWGLEERRIKWIPPTFGEN